VSDGENKLSPGMMRSFAPYLAPDEHKQLRIAIGGIGKPLPSFAEELRDLARRYIDDGDSLKLRTVCLCL
jgi:hypothetical protein